MKSQNNYIVYIHISPVNKVYIGITSQSVKERWRNGKGYKGCIHFYNAINQHGWGNFTHKILFKNLSKEDAEQKERLLIAEYNSTDKRFGYNIENGGNSNGKHSEETKIKISNSNKGKKLTEETKSLLREKHKGKKLSPEHKKKLIDILNKYRGCNKGHKTPDYVKEKISKAHLGKKHSKEFCKKVSEAKNKKVKCIETGEIFKSVKEANLKMHNRPYGSIYRVCEKCEGKAYGFHWEYIKEGTL